MFVFFQLLICEEKDTWLYVFLTVLLTRFPGFRILPSVPLQCLVLEMTSFVISHDLSAALPTSVVHPTCTSKGAGGFRPASGVGCGMLHLILSDFACNTVHNSKIVALQNAERRRRRRRKKRRRQRRKQKRRWWRRRHLARSKTYPVFSFL